MVAAAENRYFFRDLQGPPMCLERILENQPLKTFELNLDPDFIVKRIKNLKKIDSFFKTHAERIAPGIALILFIMQKTDYFPTVCKIAKMAFIPGRTIFYLDFFGKIVEDMMKLL